MNMARWLMYSDYILILIDVLLPWSEKAGCCSLLMSQLACRETV